MAHERTVLSTRSRSIVILLIFLHFVTSSSDSDAEILLRFKGYLSNNGALSNWDKARPPCNGDAENWRGILCENGTVWGLQLENMGLNGVIDVDTLANLQYLRTLSFMNNDFEGSLPNFARLGALKTIFLSNNKFSGEIPMDYFTGTASLKKVHLANNRFSGGIPTSLATLPRLMELMFNFSVSGQSLSTFQFHLRETLSNSQNLASCLGALFRRFSIGGGRVGENIFVFNEIHSPP